MSTPPACPSRQTLPDRADTVLVGAGPIGLELAVSLRHLGHDVAHLEAGNVGQTVAGYPKQTTYFSSPDRIAIAGVPLHISPAGTKATREQYLAYLHAVVRQFDLPIHTYTRVERLEPLVAENADKRNRFAVHTNRGTIHTRHVVLAIGDMHRPRLLHIPGEDLPHVAHHFDEPFPYVGQDLLIVGGKNSAVEAALHCHHAGARVTLSYRRDAFDEKAIKYWLLPELKALIQHGQIQFLPNTKPVEITPDRVTLTSNITDQTSDVAPDFVLLLTGYEQDPTLFQQAGVELTGKNQAPTLDPDTLETNMPGLFVAGTAAAGTQHDFSLFIENCHPHVRKIAHALTGQDPPAHLINTAAETFGLAES